MVGPLINRIQNIINLFFHGLRGDTIGLIPSLLFFTPPLCLAKRIGHTVCGFISIEDHPAFGIPRSPADGLDK